MLKLKSISFSGIGRFVDPQTINFESLGHLIQVDGENKNTNGSSGSGKSTIFNGLEYLLGLNDIPTTVLQSRLTKEGMFVTGHFDWDGKEVVVSRGKSKPLSVTIDGDTVEGSSKLAEEAIDKIIGIPRDLFRPMLHKRQKEGGFFLKFTPQKMNDFLIDCLGLSDLRSKIEILDKRIKVLEIDKNSLCSSIQASQSALKATQDAIITIGLPPVKDMHEDVIAGLKSKLDLSVANLKNTESNHKLKLEALEAMRPKIDIVPFDESLLNKYEEEKASINKQINDLLMAEKYRQSSVKERIYKLSSETVALSNKIDLGKKSEQEAITVALEIKKLRENKCPTCYQEWSNDSAKDKERSLLNKIREFQKIIEEGKQANQKIVDLQVTLNGLNEESKPINPPELMGLNNRLNDISTLASEEKKIKSEHSESQQNKMREAMLGFNMSYKETSDRQSQELNLCRGQVDVDRRAYDAATTKLKSYQEALDRYSASLSSLKSQENAHSSKLASLSGKIKDVEEELLMAEEAKRALKSYISCSFDDALTYISETSTNIIRHIPNMATATIQLDGLKENNNGKIKEEVNAVISMDGEIDIPIKSVSGGERSSIDLAIDLAVIDLLEVRMNRGIDVLILDEQFDGLDSVNIEQVLEVLKNSNVDKKIIMVEHDSIVKEMVSNRIVVVREGATSNVITQGA